MNNNRYNSTGIFDAKTIKTSERISKFDIPITILGESGTGKSSLARLIHGMSPRNDSPFLTLNCSSLSEKTITYELFGYESTPLDYDYKKESFGLIELSEGGTLFLDEVNCLPLSVQVKLLNILETKSFFKPGTNKKITTNIRLIISNNKPLEELVINGTFREDLFYKFNTVKIDLPPLRKRKQDIASLITLFINYINKTYNLNKSFSKELIENLKEYDWPGNIRQLEHIVEKFIFSVDSDYITLDTVTEMFGTSDNIKIEESDYFPTLKDRLEDAERLLVIEAYTRYKTSYKVAKALGISQSQAYRKIKKYIKDTKND